nr:retrovirus-related Pol polyprotein from transposon TNT 1-94 [Tanacetum cinerariifolium]
MILEPDDTNREVPVTETFHVQTDDELTKKELKQIEADDQAIQTILLGLPEDIYAAVDSCKTTQEIWLRVQQMMKGSDIGIQEKKAKLFNEREMFTSNHGESIESYYHRFLKLMNDLKRNKHFPEKIASNLKFLNNLQPDWSRHKEVDELKAERLTKTQDPLALMANSNNPYAFPALYQDQPSFNQNYMQQPMPNPEDITDPTNAMNMALALLAKAFNLNYSTPTNNNKRISSNPRNRQIAQSGMNMGQDRQMQMVGATRAEGKTAGHNGNQIRCYNCRGVGYFTRNCTIRPRRRDVAYLQNQLLIAQKEEAGIQLQAEEFDLIAAAANLDDIEEVNANCILMANLQQASTSSTQTNRVLVYDSDGSAKVHDYENCYDNDIFNIFTQEEKYIELLKPIPEPLQVPQNDNNVISEVTSVEQSGETVEQHSTNVEETRALYNSLYHNLAIEVEKVNSVNRKLKETNAELTIELARFKNQEKCFEISQEKYDKLERCYQNSVYQEQCLSKRINALHLSFEKKKMNSDFKIREDELLDKQIQLDKGIKELDNILVKTGQSIQTIHMLLPKPDSFYHTKQKMVLGYQNPFYLKQTHKKQQSLYDGKVLLEKHDPPVVHDSEETLQLAQETKFVGDFKSLAKEAEESLAKHKALELEIEGLLKEVVSQDIMSVVQNNSIVDTSNLQTELEPYNDIQQKIERLQAQLGDLKGKSKDTSCVSDTLNPLSQKLENENVELEFQVLNYAKENAHLKNTYKNLFDSISLTRTQTKTIIASLQNELQNTIFENVKLRAQLFKKGSVQKDNKCGMSMNTKFAKQSILGKPPKLGETHALSKPVTYNSIPTPQESKVVKNDKVISPRMFRINPFKTSREEKYVPNTVRASASTKLITVLQPPIFTKKYKQKANILINEKQKKQQPKVKKTKKVGFIERLATPKSSKPRSFLRWSPTGRMFDIKVIQLCLWCVDSVCSKHMTENLKLLINFVWKFLGTVRFENDHVATILGFGDLQWGNILITRVYFVEGLGQNLFSVGKFCDSDLEVACRRNACFFRNLEGVDLLSRNRTTNLYTINLHDMASASPICLMARASSTKSWLWHQRLSHLNFDTINDLAKHNLVSGLPKFKYHKEHLCPSCEQEKSKRPSHPPKPVPNSRQRLHLLHLDLCGPMRIASINGKCVGISHQVSSVRTPQQNGVVERRNRTLVEAARTMLIFSRAPLFLWAEAIATACFTQNHSIVYRRFNKTPYELINGRKLDISFLHVFEALCYPKNDREDIRKLGAKGNIGFFIGYSADSCAYRIYNQRTKKIMEAMNVSFDELSALAFEQRSSKLGLQSMTSGQISSGLDLTYAPSTITTQQPSEGELDLLFEAMYDDYIGAQPSATLRTVTAAQVQQVRQTSTTSTSIADTAPTPTNSSSQATNFPISSQDVEGLSLQQQQAQQQEPQASFQPKIVADNVSNAMFDANSFLNPFATSSTSAAESSSS